MIMLAEMKKRIAVHLQHYPENAAELLTAVAEGLTAFTESSRNYRDSVADKAILYFMADKQPKGVVYSIDAAFYQFPKGCSGGHSSAEVKWWNAFIKLRKPANLNEWLAVKGPEYIEWWERYVVLTVRPGVAVSTTYNIDCAVDHWINGRRAKAMKHVANLYGCDLQQFYERIASHHFGADATSKVVGLLSSVGAYNYAAGFQDGYVKGGEC